jgi:hypothetical protein
MNRVHYDPIEQSNGVVTDNDPISTTNGNRS